MKAATVPICEACWNIEEPERSAVRLNDCDLETCYRCGQPTRSGIYVRRMVEDKDGQR